ncbi:hypothetical protein Tco_0253581, partial [Tanacetum coccineum]
DKYVAEILKKFDLVNVKAALTPMETKVPLTKDEEAIDVDVHLDSPFDLEVFSDSDYGRSNLDRKSTTGGCQLKPCFVCGSLHYLIKKCDYYEKKMAREAALKSKRVVHADVRQATPA